MIWVGDVRQDIFRFLYILEGPTMAPFVLVSSIAPLAEEDGVAYTEFFRLSSTSIQPSPLGKVLKK